MTTTINISMPTKMYKKAKKLVTEGKYHSVSELIRAGLRRTFDEADKITENGFPGWFEDRVLEVDDSPMDKDIVLETNEDVDNFFRHLKIPKKKRKINKWYDKDKIRSGVRGEVHGFSSR